MTADNVRSAIEAFIEAEAKARGMSPADVWKKHPNLVDRWRDAPTIERNSLKRGKGETVADRATSLVADAAHKLMWKDFGARRDLTDWQIRNEIWATPEGRLLATISRSRYGNLPWDAVSTKIAKDATWGEAARLLRDGLPV